ncbi:MAG: CDP-alcohol phosphatidyltransferase family protein [Anaerolineae bacterium]|nr:CDP-alcohol phosphatidyltransferase family protein [Anaerolineae bacterium]
MGPSVSAPLPARPVWQRKALAWSVHLLTASGALIGLLALFATVELRWTAAFAWLGLAALIDGLDGTLARRFDTKQYASGIDGALLDNIVDYFTYVIVPAFIVYQAQLVPATWTVAAVAIISITSAYQFSQTDAKTDDHFFKGFPSYWNVLVFYLFMLKATPIVGFGIIALLGLLVFVPIHYLYPSRMTAFQKITLILTGLWLGSLGLIWWQYAYSTVQPWLGWLSLSYVVYYVCMSIYLTLRSR